MPQESQSVIKSKHVDPSGYFSTRTICALCTPTGGALSVIRVSGEMALSYGEKMTQLDLKTTARSVQRASLKDHHGKTMDHALVTSFVKPKSFTGEDVVEFCTHGSPIVAQKILDELVFLGARIALPGEFSFRAMRNGKVTLSQAEAVNDLIKAENDLMLDLALEKLEGSMNVLLTSIRDQLMQLVTLAEAGIDFSDQDLDEVSLPALRVRLDAVMGQLMDLGSSFSRGNRFAEGIKVSIFGLPNAGKSSFFNALLGEDRSIVSTIEGTTRDVVKEKINLKGAQGVVSFRIADTAGLRRTHDHIESLGIERTLKSARESELLLVVIDSTNPCWEKVSPYFKMAYRPSLKVIGILNKFDLLDAVRDEKGKEKLEELKKQAQESFGVKVQWHAVSSVTLEGVREVADSMVSESELYLDRKPGEMVLTRFEHVQAVEAALECLKRAKNATDIVLFATDVRHGMNALGPLLGETLPDDILGKIFSDFCIGK